MPWLEAAGSILYNAEYRYVSMGLEALPGHAGSREDYRCTGPAACR